MIKPVVKRMLLAKKAVTAPPAFVMTSNTAPSPYVASASSTLSGYPAFQAYDNNTATFWANDGDTSASITIDYGAQYTFSSVEITVRSDVANQNPVDFTLQSSNNGSSFSTFSTQTGVSWSPTFVKTYTFTPVTCRYLRVNVSASGGIFISISEIKWS